jgi:hypothetical protein
MKVIRGGYTVMSIQGRGDFICNRVSEGLRL